MQEFSLIYALLVIITSFVVNIVYAIYTMSVVKKNATLSATCSSLIPLLCSVSVISYVENFYYVIPMCLGSFFGTFFLVKFYGHKND